MRFFSVVARAAIALDILGSRTVGKLETSSKIACQV